MERMRGGFVTCMGMSGSGVGTGMEIIAMMPLIPRDPFRDLLGYCAVVAGMTEHAIAVQQGVFVSPQVLAFVI